MARPSEGWKLRPPRDACGSYTVRFRWDGIDYERSCRTREPDRAAKEAARIYARVVSTPKRQRPQARPAGDLEGAVAQWCESLIGKLDASTIASYADFGRSHWVPFFEGQLHNVTDANLERYTQERLGRVLAQSVKKELSGLRGFTTWAAQKGLMPPVTVPTVPKKATGVPFARNGKPVRRRVAAIALSPTETRKIIAALPEWSSSPRVPEFPVRARFEVAYETGLRPELLDLLSVPEHYRKGAKEINITRSLDKGRWARRVPITKKAQKALDRVCPADGLIFGKHDYRTPLGRAARKVLPPERAEAFTGTHLRSARATHWLDDGAPLTGVQFLLGHLHTETTAKYIKPSERAARAVIKGR